MVLETLFFGKNENKNKLWEPIEKIFFYSLINYVLGANYVPDLEKKGEEGKSEKIKLWGPVNCEFLFWKQSQMVALTVYWNISSTKHQGPQRKSLPNGIDFVPTEWLWVY